MVAHEGDNPTLYKLVNDGTNLLKMIDDDPLSVFHFTIHKSDNDDRLRIEYKPQSFDNTDSQTTWVEPKSIGTYFEMWYRCLAAYNELEQFYKDPFLRN